MSDPSSACHSLLCRRSLPRPVYAQHKQIVVRFSAGCAGPAPATGLVNRLLNRFVRDSAEMRDLGESTDLEPANSAPKGDRRFLVEHAALRRWR